MGWLPLFEYHQAVIFPRGHTEIVRRKYRKLFPIIIIYCLKHEYLNTTTDLLNLYVLNALNSCHSHRKFVNVIARPQKDKKKMIPWSIPKVNLQMDIETQSKESSFNEYIIFLYSKVKGDIF